MIAKIREKIILKYNSFGLRIANKLKLNYIPFLPTYLDIEPINSCNFKCEHCKVSYWEKQYEILSFDSFKKILSQFQHLKSIKLQGLGEPLLNKELSKMILFANDKGIKINFFSNGSIYDKITWREINASNNVHIVFSIDAASKEIFEEIRKGGNFDKVVSNIQKIVIDNELKYSFWTVLNKANINQLPKIIELAEKLNIKKVTFQTFLNDWQSSDVQAHNKTIIFDAFSDIYIHNETLSKRLANKYEIDLEIYKENYLSKKQKCSWPFMSAFIASNGDVVPCCVLADSDIIKMGNLFEAPFKDIWNSEKYQDFRKSISNHELHDACKNCYGEKT